MMKLYELWKLALEDLRIVESDSKFTIDMGKWYHRGLDNTCTGCIAGAMIYLGHIARTCCDEASAINYLRQGYITDAYAFMYFPKELEVENFRYLDYRADKAVFWADAEALLLRLKELGI